MAADVNVYSSASNIFDQIMFSDKKSQPYWYSDNLIISHEVHETPFEVDIFSTVYDFFFVTFFDAGITFTCYRYLRIYEI